MNLDFGTDLPSKIFNYSAISWNMFDIRGSLKRESKLIAG